MEASVSVCRVVACWIRDSVLEAWEAVGREDRGGRASADIVYDTPWLLVLERL